jgi:hypothetical protein
VQAEIMKGMQSEQPQQAPAGANPRDPTGAGGGTIGTGIAPTPGEQGFTGVPQQGGQANTQPTQTVGQQPQATEQLQ